MTLNEVSNMKLYNAYFFTECLKLVTFFAHFCITINTYFLNSSISYEKETRYIAVFIILINSNSNSLKFYWLKFPPHIAGYLESLGRSRVCQLPCLLMLQFDYLKHTSYLLYNKTKMHSRSRYTLYDILLTAL